MEYFINECYVKKRENDDNIITLEENLETEYFEYHLNKINYFSNKLELLQTSKIYTFEYVSSLFVKNNLNKFKKLFINLPCSLRTLLFHNEFNNNIRKLPFKLKKISFGNNFDRNIKNLGSSIELLILGDKYTGKYNNLPKSLKQLSLKTSLATYLYPSGTCCRSRIDNIDFTARSILNGTKNNFI